MSDPQADRASSVGQRLLADHRRLDRLFDRLLAQVHVEDWVACEATWNDFEQSLLRHMEAEEHFMLPDFERGHPLEAEAIRRDHAALRSLLSEMGVQLDLHAVREESVIRLVESLRAHAKREEKVFYPWASELAPNVAEPLRQRLSSKRKAHLR